MMTDDPTRDTSSEKNVEAAPDVVAIEDENRHVKESRKWKRAAWINLLLAAVFILLFACLSIARLVTTATTGFESSQYHLLDLVNITGLSAATVVFSFLTVLYSVVCAIALRRQQISASQVDLAALGQKARAITLAGAVLLCILATFGFASVLLAFSFDYYVSLDSTSWMTLYNLIPAELALFSLSLFELILALTFSGLTMRHARRATADGGERSKTTTTGGAIHHQDNATIERDELQAEKERFQHVGAQTQQAMPFMQSSSYVSATPPAHSATQPPRGTPLFAPTASARPNNPLLQSVV